jgi:cell wall-associated NlpC family hydrolase
MKILVLTVILQFGLGIFISAESAEYAVARISAPVLNSPDFNAVFGGTSGRELKVDRCGQVRELEYIALPGTLFTILKKLHSGSVEIYQVETDEYKAPPNRRLYVDSRFLKHQSRAPSPRIRSIPTRGEIVATLREAVGVPYVWGGNVLKGVPELAAWFYQGIKDDDTGRLTLAGLDCSGLLYHATGGWTPRNSSNLVAYGQGVAISGKQSAEIAELLQPLDLIVWNGHVIIVLDRQSAIESRLECSKPGHGGVVITPLPQRIAQIMRTRRPANSWRGAVKRQDLFVVRRWYP